MDHASLTGRVAVITGATRGLGRAMADRLADSGAAVVLVGRSTDVTPNRVLPGTLEEVEAVLRSRGATVVSIPADISKDDDVAHVVEVVEQRFGGCDLLVNNAAVSFLGPFADVGVSKWRSALAVNLLAPVMLCQALLPGMIERGHGRVLNIGSGAAHSDGVLQLPYSVSKLGLERLTIGLAHQLATESVAVNCIRVDEVVPTEAVTLHTPELGVGAPCSPEQFAAAAAWVLSRPSWFSGQVLTMGQLRDLGAFSG